MDVKESLLNKLLYHFQQDEEWMEFFNALLNTVDWSIFDFVHYEDSEVGQIKLYNRTDQLHAATSTGFEELIAGGTAIQPTEVLDGGTAVTPSSSLEIQDSWSSILRVNIPFSVGKRYTIIESSPANAANFYYNGNRTHSILYQGGPVYMERWDINWVLLLVEGASEGFNLNYAINDFPLLFSPGNYYNLKYAYALYKKRINVRYESDSEKITSYKDHWLHSPKFLDLQTIYCPNLGYAFPEISTFTDKLYKATLDSGSVTLPIKAYIEDLETDLIGEIYSYSHGVITLKEPCTNFTLPQLQGMEDTIIYRRQYQYAVSGSTGIGYVPTVLPTSLRAYISKTRRFLAKFTTESVPARIDIPVVFS